ncbi:MAG: CRISPR-associated protein Cas5 [candidate division KSB1 bacterium]|nr:CRISPR-associated protein Cas5 [candidate division KSB1 bacterium]
MRVLKILAEGLTTSFRYPHFMQGVQPSFDMPPPATIYGLICSTLGEWVTPKGVQFAYHFTFKTKKEDEIEHTHILTASSGKLKNSDLPKVLEGNINPFKRHLLFFPRLVLYLNKPEWEAAFKSPRYAVALGRSQDLFTYSQVRTLELVPSEHAYVESTLLPYEIGLRASRGVAVLMPRFLDYYRHREPRFDRYIMLPTRVHTSEFLRLDGDSPRAYWLDPESPEVKGDKLGLVFQSFVD